MGFFEPFAGLLAAFYAVIPSYGLAIILLTLTTRILLLPLSIKSTRSMREMQIIQPEIKKLQKKHKGDRQKLNVEMMALYKEHGVNPFGGCMPLLLQMPVFIALFRVIQTPRAYLVPWDSSGLYKALDTPSTALDVHNFFGLRLDCSVTRAWEGAHGPIANITEICGGSPLKALPYIMLILLMAGATFYQQRQMMAARGGSTDPKAQQMQTFMKVMPLMLLVFGLGFPAGVVLYWVTTNAWTIIQQRIMLKAAPPIQVSQVTGTKAKTTKAKTTKAMSSGDGSPAKGGSKTTSKSTGQAAKKTTAKNSSGNPAEKSPSSKTTSSGSPNRSKKKRKR
ncbi:MAG TPA: YidC/Oxa1 family membrane protein insertase [Actinomycetota bacterium]|nr:YidC/Oxa1 family membrane protein insertase [Actinomycetota bacterium]